MCVSVEPSGFWAVQRYMEPLSSAGTRSNTSSFPSLSALPSSSLPPIRVQVNRGSGNTSFWKKCVCLVHKDVYIKEKGWRENNQSEEERDVKYFRTKSFTDLYLIILLIFLVVI